MLYPNVAVNLMMMLDEEGHDEIVTGQNDRMIGGTFSIFAAVNSTADAEQQ